MELQYAKHPHSINADLFDRPTFENLNWEVIEESAEIIPGASDFLTPGYSPSGQLVKMNTSSGKAIITGFCCEDGKQLFR
jgi:N-acyl homoserine lactone hydrolase